MTILGLKSSVFTFGVSFRTTHLRTHHLTLIGELGVFKYLFGAACIRLGSVHHNRRVGFEPLLARSMGYISKKAWKKERRVIRRLGQKEDYIQNLIKLPEGRSAELARLLLISVYAAPSTLYHYLEALVGHIDFDQVRRRDANGSMLGCPSCTARTVATPRVIMVASPTPGQKRVSKCFRPWSFPDADDTAKGIIVLRSLSKSPSVEGLIQTFEAEDTTPYIRGILQMVKTVRLLIEHM
ncbi:hypothetical protein K449DRAFT_430235 [Hypoxylon sp. EC38]|nr:hypothetical protein K449DRAFT_430235 [Hypoxylon sp. EC38]